MLLCALLAALLWVLVGLQLRSADLLVAPFGLSIAG